MAEICEWLDRAYLGVDWCLGGWLTLLVRTALAFIILYRTIPGKRASWRDVWLGGLSASLIWEAARRLYTWYLANLVGYSRTSSVRLV